MEISGATVMECGDYPCGQMAAARQSTIYWTTTSSGFELPVSSPTTGPEEDIGMAVPILVQASRHNTCTYRSAYIYRYTHTTPN
ncbi:hypothetical protein LguiB_000613 [Lonicera macranthoides]